MKYNQEVCTSHNVTRLTSCDVYSSQFLCLYTIFITSSKHIKTSYIWEKNHYIFDTVINEANMHCHIRYYLEHTNNNRININ